MCWKECTGPKDDAGPHTTNSQEFGQRDSEDRVPSSCYGLLTDLCLFTFWSHSVLVYVEDLMTFFRIASNFLFNEWKVWLPTTVCDMYWYLNKWKKKTVKNMPWCCRHYLPLIANLQLLYFQDAPNRQCKVVGIECNGRNCLMFVCTLPGFQGFCKFHIFLFGLQYKWWSRRCRAQVPPNCPFV